MKLLALAAAALFTASTGSMLLAVPPTQPSATVEPATPDFDAMPIVDLPAIVVHPDPADVAQPRIVDLPAIVVHPQPEDRPRA